MRSLFLDTAQWTSFGSSVGVGIRIGIHRIKVYTNTTGSPFANPTSSSSVYLNQMSSIQNLADSCIGHGLTNQQFDGGLLFRSAAMIISHFFF